MSDNIIVIGASAGGLKPMIRVLRVLPRNLDAPVVVAIHGGQFSQLTEVLTGKVLLPVQKATDGQRLERGVIAVCPGGEHTRVEGRTLRLGRLPDAARFQPSVDLLFRSAAESYGAGTVAVVLSGNLNDGTMGAQAVHEAGGCTLVQAPGEADFASMPASVVLHDHPDAELKAEHIAQRLLDMVGARGLVRPD
ncbi:chemotaxis protein CheB [uncultured Tateyamaria sp.]|uniref:chemotaxis protein CheB n=1 Tax=uncultured Tateyamaria sp. TaxID=455651 RepID=UPI00260F4562|nr:chemotaxis protein CheB [uncultured Tateyamaria sp.]